MKKVVLFFALAVGLLTSASTAMAQTVNMNRYITLTVTDGAAIKLDFQAAANGTPVRIVSGSNTQDITVGTGWLGRAYYTAGSTTMTIYGDIIGFDCYDNRSNLTALNVSKNTQLEMLYCYSNTLSSLDVSNNTQLTYLNCSSNPLSSLDVSHNTQLQKLICWGNNFSTQALDDIYCSLPDRQASDNARIQPIYTNTSSNHSIVLATNKANATAKNWNVQYFINDTDIPATTGTYVCSGGGEPNMSRYITLTVAKDSAIRLDFKAAAAGTPVRIVSGSNTQDITVGSDWTGFANYTADGTTMTVYGDIIGFSCSGNRANLTALDLSHNTQLTVLNCSSNQLTSLDVTHNTQLIELNCHNNSLNSLDILHNTQLWGVYCHGNNFSTQALDDIYCALPDRTSETFGVIQPVRNSSSTYNDTVIASNAANATAKNWRVQYFSNDADIPVTTGTYVCGTPHPVDTSRYITLTVSKGEVIKLDFKAAAANTSVRIKSGITDTTITVGTSWKGITSYTAADSVMTVYGDIIVFDCSNNRAKLTAIDLSHHTQLTELYCTNNKITSLDVSNNTQLTGLYCTSNQLSSLNASGCTQLKTLNCVSNQLLSLNVSGCTQLTKVECFSNRLSSLDVSGYTQLKELNCHGNQLSNINVSGCTQLKELKCYNNQLASLNISGCTQLKELYCYNNILTALDVSGCTQLTKVYCHDNKLSTDALDDIYCALPDRKDSINGVIQPVDNSSSTYNDTVIASNAANATSKNWKVQYYSNDADIATTGSYVCGTPHTKPNMDSYITLTVKKDSAIKLDFLAAAANTPVRIVSGSTTQNITVGTGWLGEATYTAGGTTMTVYGDIIGFDCSENGVNLTALDLSHNTQLTGLGCSNNRLSNLDISHNTQLTELYCRDNKLSSLDVSNNTQLTTLDCSENQLTTLDVSHNTQLKYLYCYDNNFSTATLDDIYCALPDRTGKENGKIQPVFNSSSSYNDTVLATNAQNAIDKNWKVQYYDDDTDIPTTTGKHKCSATDIAEAAAEPQLTLYPNPVADVLYLSSTARTIRVYDIYGIEVAHATDTDRVEVSHLPAGIYTVRADGTVAKMVKR